MMNDLIRLMMLDCHHGLPLHVCDLNALLCIPTDHHITLYVYMCVEWMGMISEILCGVVEWLIEYCIYISI
jgi:hypothetical protein